MCQMVKPNESEKSSKYWHYCQRKRPSALLSTFRLLLLLWCENSQNKNYLSMWCATATGAARKQKALFVEEKTWKLIYFTTLHRKKSWAVCDSLNWKFRGWVWGSCPIVLSIHKLQTCLTAKTSALTRNWEIS